MKIFITLLIAFTLATSGALVMDLTSLHALGGTLIMTGIYTSIAAFALYLDSIV